MKFKMLLIATFLSCTFVGYAQDAKTEQKYDAEAIADVFYKLNGDSKQPHKKINHTKGFCALANFIPTKDITKHINVPLLAQYSIPTQVRYSLGGGNPHASDKSKVRGMALKMQGDKEEWELVMLNTEINFAKNPQEFWQFFAMKIPVNGKVDKEKIEKLTNEVDSYRNYEAYLDTIGITPSLANTAFYSIHTFYIEDSKSKKPIPARWKFVPTQGIQYADEKTLATLNDDFLEKDFQTHIQQKPIVYEMYLVYANPKDITNDTTALWKGKHKEVLVGKLEVNKYSGDSCNGDVFMPQNLPSGITPPKDPLFEIRNEVYGITFGRRQ